MSFKDLSLMKDKKNASVLFYPYIPKLAWKAIKKRLATRWIGEGPMVKLFEKRFSQIFLHGKKCIAVGSGTDALHLAYILAGIKKGDEVITSVFTCTATNIPLLYIGAKIKFADIDPKTMNICPSSVEKLITTKTKAIVVVHYGGISCDLDKINEIYVINLETHPSSYSLFSDVKVDKDKTNIIILNFDKDNNQNLSNEKV